VIVGLVVFTAPIIMIPVIGWLIRQI
jgi:hypothetical protein